MQKAIGLAAAVAASGCYVDVRARGELATTNVFDAGPPPGAIFGVLVAIEATAGVRIEMDPPGSSHLEAGAGAERVLAASRHTAIAGVIGEAAALALRGPKHDVWPRAAEGFEARFQLTNWSMTDPVAGVNGAEVRGTLSAVFGGPRASISIGPSLAWWDAQRANRSLSVGAEVGGHLVFNPLP